MKNLLRLLRPHQYIKNGFVLISVVFSRQWDAQTLCHALLAFVAFCSMASAVYTLNDIFDAQSDRQHPQKRNRPIANGSISMAHAYLIALLLVIAALITGYVVSITVSILLTIYLLMNIAYTLRLKHIVILDVFIIAAGFMLRLLAGSAGLGIDPSNWFLLCGLMLTLFLGFAKRRSELLMLENAGITGQNGTRPVLNDYSPAMLEQYISVTAACTVLSYGLFTVSKDTMHGKSALIYTLPFVIYGIFRYLFLLHQRAKGGDTAYDLVTDPHMLLTVAGWLIICVFMLM